MSFQIFQPPIAPNADMDISKPVIGQGKVRDKIAVYLRVGEFLGHVAPSFLRFDFVVPLLVLYLSVLAPFGLRRLSLLRMNRLAAVIVVDWTSTLYSIHIAMGTR